jgi:mRNA interferase RelE/StbE
MQQYKLIIKKQAAKKLQRLSAKERVKIAEKIYSLGLDPDNKLLDIKPLTNTRMWRLRVNDWRIIYAREDAIKVIAIEKIKARGEIYK